MNNKKTVILCPEIVPMDNKGEEAIIRGVIDTLGLNDENCEYHIVDTTVKEMTVIRGLYVHPVSLFFSEWRTKEFGLGFSFERIYSSICSLLRHILYRVHPSWVLSRPKVVTKLMRYIEKASKNDCYDIPKQYRKSIEHLSKIDYVIAGHNGGLNEDVCHVLLGLHEIGVRYTIFGSCMKPSVKQKELLEIYNQTFLHADNVITRNPLGYRWAVENFQNIKTVLVPDPAFGMNPIPKEESISLIDSLGLTHFFSKEVLLVTTAEPAPISMRSFDDCSGRVEKIKAHRRFFASLVNELIKQYDFNILFLPHTIGPTVNMDDRAISKDILYIANQKNDINGRCYVLDADLSAAQLKGIISLGTMLLAERVHSVIGAIGVHTPLMCMGSKYDNRLLGMIKEYADLGDNIYYLNTPNLNECITFFDRIYRDRKNQKELLTALDNKYKSLLEEVSHQIKWNKK